MWSPVAGRSRGEVSDDAVAANRHGSVVTDTLAAMSRGVSSREALNPDSATDREQIERKPARFGELSRDRVESSTVAWGVLAVALVAAAGLLYHLTRGTTFWFDEW